MFKRAFFAVVAVSIVWSIVDFVIHGIILGNAYQETATLWRPMEQMKHGVLFGAAVGVPMGYGTYAVMPLPARHGFVLAFRKSDEGDRGRRVGRVHRQVTHSGRTNVDQVL
jgi:hypothetical protein